MPISCLQWPAFQEFMAYWPAALWIYCKPEPSGAEANTYVWGILWGCRSVLQHLHTDRLRRAIGTAPWRRAANLISESIPVGWRDRQLLSAQHLLDFRQLGTLCQYLAQPGHILRTHHAIPETEANKALRSSTFPTATMWGSYPFISQSHTP